MAAVPALPRRRIGAAAMDLGIGLGWSLLVFGAASGMVGLGWLPTHGSLVVGMILLAVMVFPVTATLATLEAGRYEATWGKLRFGLRVRTVKGERLGWGRAFLRNLLKLGLPWILGQLSLLSALHADATQATPGLAVSLILWLLFGWGALRGDGRTPYDHLLDTEVIPTVSGRRFAD